LLFFCPNNSIKFDVQKHLNEYWLNNFKTFPSKKAGKISQGQTCMASLVRGGGGTKRGCITGGSVAKCLEI
jgi:hypothetical protein